MGFPGERLAAAAGIAVLSAPRFFSRRCYAALRSNWCSGIVELQLASIILFGFGAVPFYTLWLRLVRSPRGLCAADTARDRARVAIGASESHNFGTN